MTRRLGSCLIALFVGIGGAGPSTLAQAPSAIFVGRHVAADGTLGPAATIRLREGKIDQITPGDDIPEGDDVVAYPNAVLSPGLIDLRSALSCHGRRSTSSRSIDADVSAVDAIDWQHRDFDHAIAAGITAALITPRENNLVAGAAVVIKTDARRRIVVRRDGPLTLSMGPAVWRFDRAPTSRSGSVAMLRDALDAARRGEGAPRLQAVVAGQLDTMIYCAAAMDISAVMRLLDGIRAPVCIAYPGAEPDLAYELKDRDTILIAGPYSFESAPEHLAAAGRYARQDVDIALAGQFPLSGRDSLRTTAALATRYGLPPEAARRAITATAARAAGVAERLGALSPGLDADMVVFSDDPLRLDARVLAVYIDGVRVFAHHDDDAP